MDKLKKAAFRKALPFLIGGLAFFLSLLFITAVVAEMMAVIGSDAGANNKRYKEEEERQQINLFSLDRYTITGQKVGNKYFLTFLFSGWKIDEIELEDIPQSQSITVKIPSISGTREEMAYSYLVRKGFTPEGACGLLANIDVESGHTWKGTIEEGFSSSYQGKEVLWKGYGLCQWTNTETVYGISWRRKNLIEHLENKGLDPSVDSDALFFEQLNYAITEPGYENIISRIKYSTDANRAAEIWCREWENPDNVDAQASRRGRIAEEYFAAYKNKDVNVDSSGSFDEVTLKLKIEKEDGMIYLDGHLNGTNIAGAFKDGKDDLSGYGTYGAGAYSRGGVIASPYGTTKFYITSVAMVYRIDPVTGQGLTIHRGWDLDGGDDGQPIYSVTSGTVVLAGYIEGGGNNCVVIQSGDLFVQYAHMSAKFVSVGDVVTAGQRIGSQGNEGWSTASHLHLEFRRGSIWGEATANLEDVKAMFMENAINYNSVQYQFNEIIR